jgi:flavodoxin
MTWSLLIAATMSLLSVATTAQQAPAGVQPVFANKKVLIVYLSRTGNTKAIADMIHQQVGGTLVALELDKPYPTDYKTTVDQVARENETGYLPPLKTKIDGIEQFDVIFLGFPTWGMQLPPPMKSFLRDYILQGKTVIPFNSNGGYGVGTSFQTVKDLCQKCTILDGFTTRGGVERDGRLLAIQGTRAQAVRKEIESWLQKINAPVRNTTR